jgi:hypothetical protein
MLFQPGDPAGLAQRPPGRFRHPQGPRRLLVLSMTEKRREVTDPFEQRRKATSSSSSPAMCALALDHCQSAARSHSRARTGFTAT